MSEKKVNSILDKLKNKVKNQEVYGGRMEERDATLSIKDCPNCGAGRAQQDGITHCAYCGHEFIGVKVSDGLNIKKEDNSQTT